MSSVRRRRIRPPEPRVGRPCASPTTASSDSRRNASLAPKAALRASGCRRRGSRVLRGVRECGIEAVTNYAPAGSDACGTGTMRTRCPSCRKVVREPRAVVPGGRAVVPGGRAVVREPARSYLRSSLTYDLTQEGTTARWGVRPRAGMYDRVPGCTTACRDVRPRAGMYDRVPGCTTACRDVRPRDPEHRRTRLQTRNSPAHDSRDPDAPDHLARPTHPGSTHGFKVTDGRPIAGRAHSDITRSRPAREAGSRPLSAHLDGPEPTESAESPAFRSDTRIVPHDPDRTPEREKPGVRLDAWLRPLAPAAPPAPRCAYSTRSPSALSRARSGPRSCGSPGRPRAPTCCAPRTQWSPPGRGPRSPRRRRPTPAGRSAPRRARD